MASIPADLEQWPKIETVEADCKLELLDAVRALLRNTLLGVTEKQFTTDSTYVESIKLSLDSASQTRKDKYDRRGNWQVVLASHYAVSASTFMRFVLYESAHLIIFYA